MADTAVAPRGTGDLNGLKRARSCTGRSSPEPARLHPPPPGSALPSAPVFGRAGACSLPAVRAGAAAPSLSPADPSGSEHRQASGRVFPHLPSLPFSP